MTGMIFGVLNTDDAENPKPAAGLDGLDEQLINQMVVWGEDGWPAADR